LGYWILEEPNITVTQIESMSQSILLEDLEIYQLGLEIGEEVWKIVGDWEFSRRKRSGAVR